MGVRVLLWEIEPSQLVFISALRLGLLDLKIMLEVSLLALEVKVGFDNSVDSPHVRIAIDVKSPHKLSNILWILPLFNTLIKAEVDQGNCWRSADA